MLYKPPFKTRVSRYTNKGVSNWTIIRPRHLLVKKAHVGYANDVNIHPEIFFSSLTQCCTEQSEKVLQQLRFTVCTL